MINWSHWTALYIKKTSFSWIAIFVFKSYEYKHNPNNANRYTLSIRDKRLSVTCFHKWVSSYVKLRCCAGQNLYSILSIDLMSTYSLYTKMCKIGNNAELQHASNGHEKYLIHIIVSFHLQRTHLCPWLLNIPAAIYWT